MPEALQHIMTEMTPWLQQYGYLILALAIAIEGVGIPAPGQSLLIVASLLAAAGQMSLPLVLIVAGSSAFIGNSLGYFLGIKFGDVLLKKGWIKESTEAKLHGFIGKYGLVALLLSRFIEGLKQTIFIGCGMAKMSLNKFLLGNTLATGLWLTLFGLGPVLIRDELTPILAFYHHHQHLFWLIVTALGIISLMIFTLILRRRRTCQVDE
ncbi:DedA family protein [Shewanella sp. D64]|uniref:DedA family protein n=1 Tax=unclassified Shewanella TaxID=196818 RepID=UPI0022BA29D0|nr:MULTISPECIES: DedA family protein [unclassified Shewanella]MEC4726104.1 DedA family protein [Shewanella sp. D64]MEC4737980.1 DedA family protein [Shewanella sp. E94]WBJ96179.1 DedA family protein [Shewanella sp. MTB7]